VVRTASTIAGNPDTRGDHRRGSFQRLRIGWSPSRLRDCFCRSNHCEQHEAIHFTLFFAHHDDIRIEAAVGVIGFVRHDSSHPGHEIRAYRGGQRAQARSTGEQARPNQFYAAAQRRHRAHTRHNNPAHVRT
jgi:hypothetical protein